MQLAVVHTRAQLGIHAPAVTVETHLSGGLPAMSIVGLPEATVRESRERVRSALQACGLDYPVGRITINLAPADLPKYGGRYDLPIAVGILAASGQVPARAVRDAEFLGELALGGALRPVPGALCASLATTAAGRTLVVAAENADEAALPDGARVLAVRSLGELCAHLRGTQPLPLHVPPPQRDEGEPLPDLRDVRGQAQARRALEIAAAGGHALLLIGPPGTGKSMLAARLAGILPPLTPAEALQVAAVRSLRGGGARPTRRRPVRAPHHSVSAIALVGGGGNPRPGEVSLAHNGVLFLDELPEFGRHALDMLREPMECGSVAIARASRQVEFPAAFQLVAAMNPCPCGWLGDPQRACGYSCDRADRYRARVSGPLLDRIDLHVEVPPLAPALLAGRDTPPPEDSATVRARVEAARARQLSRQGCSNAQLGARTAQLAAALGDADRAFLQEALARLRLSARATDRVLRVARTISDLGGHENVTRAHLLEALAYRALDRRASAPPDQGNAPAPAGA